VGSCGFSSTLSLGLLKSCQQVYGSHDKKGAVQAGPIFATTSYNVSVMKQRFPLPLVVGVLSALGAGLALLFVTRQKGQQMAAGRPPRKAPQLHLQNPGTQDDFPKPPMESEIG